MLKLKVASIDCSYQPESNLTLSLLLNNSTAFDIAETSFTVPPSAPLSLSLKSNSSEVFQSLPINTSVFSLNESIWISLLPSKNPDFTLTPAKVLIKNERFESKNFTNNSTSLGRYESEGKLKQLEDPVARKIIIDEIAEEINNELKNSVKKLWKLLDIEKAAKEVLVKDLQNMKNDILRERDENKKREKAILTDLQSAESTNSEMKFELMKVKTENKAVLAENKRLLALANEKEKWYNSNLEQYSGLIKHLELEASSSTNLLKKIDEISSKSNSAHSEQIKSKEDNIKELHREISELKILNKSILLTRQLNKSDEIDELIAQKSKNLKLPGSFLRDPEQNYIFNNKKLTLIARNGQLLCRVGSIYKPFEEYMESIGYTTRSSSHKRIRSMDIKPDNIDSSRSSKTLIARKVTRSPNNLNR